MVRLRVIDYRVMKVNASATIIILMLVTLCIVSYRVCTVDGIE